MNHRIPIVNAVLIGSTILLALLATVVWLFPPGRMRLLNLYWSPYGGGGGCFDLASYYDYQGRLLELDKLDPYPGKAPLYYPDSTILEPLIPDPCETLPDAIPPDIVVNLPTVYPLVLYPELVSQMRTGESARLRLTAIIQDQFSGLNYSQYYVIQIQPGEEINLKFDLDAPNFEYSQDDHIAKLMIGRPVQLEWIIAPKERAQGEQSIDVYLGTLPGDKKETLPDLFFYKLSVEVRPMSDVDPTLSAKLYFLGSLIMGILTAVKTIHDMLPKSSSPVEEKPREQKPQEARKGKRER